MDEQVRKSVPFRICSGNVVEVVVKPLFDAETFFEYPYRRRVAFLQAGFENAVPCGFSKAFKLLQ